MGICGSTPAVKQDAKPELRQNGHTQATPQVSQPRQPPLPAPVSTPPPQPEAMQELPVTPEQVVIDLVSDRVISTRVIVAIDAIAEVFASTDHVQGMPQGQPLSAEPILTEEPTLVEEPQATGDFSRQYVAPAPRLASEVSVAAVKSLLPIPFCPAC